ncbi:MAG: hypothetical protein LC659_12075, partial [Myxococcales bacterium]|nr:hypothetical protein [Myxococcales bacterium]
HRLWVTRPGADEAEETYAADNAPCRVDAGDGEIAAAAPVDASGIEKTLRVRVVGDGELVVEHVLRNCGDMLWSGGAWALSCTRPRRGDSYGIPLGSDDEWDAFSVVVPRRWGGGHTSLVADKQLDWHEHALVVRPTGRECKRMLQAPRGMVGMTSSRERVAFVKRASWDEAGDYPLGTNIAFYVGPRSFMVEMETMSPLRQLKPGASLGHVERWQLRRPIDWRDERAVERLLHTG